MANITLPWRIPDTGNWDEKTGNFAELSHAFAPVPDARYSNCASGTSPDNHIEPNITMDPDDDCVVVPRRRVYAVNA